MGFSTWRWVVAAVLGVGLATGTPPDPTDPDVIRGEALKALLADKGLNPAGVDPNAYPSSKPHAYCVGGYTTNESSEITNVHRFTIRESDVCEVGVTGKEECSYFGKLSDGMLVQLFEAPPGKDNIMLPVEFVDEHAFCDKVRASMTR